MHPAGGARASSTHGSTWRASAGAILVKPLNGSRTFLRELYEGESRRAVRFRYGLLLFDLLTIVFMVMTSFVQGGPVLEVADAGSSSSYSVRLFLRMVQVLFQPGRLHHECLSCGLSEHESDAVHCRCRGALLACGSDAAR